MILRFLSLFLFLILNMSIHSWAATSADADDVFLEKISQKMFRFFIHEINPENGLIRDRAFNEEGHINHAPSSVAAIGFGLTAYGVAVERGWIQRDRALKIVRNILSHALYEYPHEKGFFYHFMDFKTARRAAHSELSPIDTALFITGALFAMEYFNDPEVTHLATQLYERIDFPWMLDGGESFALSWSPEDGFDKRKWGHFDESLLLYMLAIGSPTYPISAESWHSLEKPVGSYKKHRLIYMPPLFTHQYPHIWFDYRNKHDGFANYFNNSIAASEANYEFVQDQSARFDTYKKGLWGLTACDGPGGYRAYGAPPGYANHDGTIAPTGCGASIVFTPEKSIRCLKSLYENYKDRIWGRYGYSDALNVDKKWYSNQVLGIDQGALILMIENYRSGLIWEKMNQNTWVQKAFEKIGFEEGDIELPWPEPPLAQAKYVLGGMEIDGYLRDWPNMETVHLGIDHREFGEITDEKDLDGKVRFAWDDRYLYIAAQVKDDSFVLKQKAQHIWKDDLMEVYIDPEGNGFFWDNKKDFQLGFRANKGTNDVSTWSWFQKLRTPPHKQDVRAKGFLSQGHYIIEAQVSWRFLGKTPRKGEKLNLSIALHDVDEDRSHGKLQWFYRNEGELMRFGLGQVELV